jgi:hypothetical protein
MKRTIFGFLLIAAPYIAFAEGPGNGVQGPSPELIYEALAVLERRVVFSDPEIGNPIIGVDVFEKSVGGLLCRRSAPVVFEPVFTYICYIERSLTSNRAMALYSRLDAPELQVQYVDPETGAPLVGVTILERQQGGLLCQRVAAVVPEPVPTYRCYRDVELDIKVGKQKGDENGPIPVTIDIRPGSDENPINPRSRGRIPVAVLTTEDFDASLVDVSTVRFGPGGAAPVRYALEDVDGDADWDLVMHFNAEEVGIACGDSEATLTGQTFDGVLIAGTGSIKTVGCINR